MTTAIGMPPGSRYNFDVYLFFKSKYYVTIDMIANNEQKRITLGSIRTLVTRLTKVQTV